VPKTRFERLEGIEEVIAKLFGVEGDMRNTEFLRSDLLDEQTEHKSGSVGPEHLER
jgi:hypothetical protein